MKFTNRSSILKVYLTKEFKDFKDQVIWPYEIKKSRLLHGFNFFKKFFPENGDGFITCYNKMKSLVKEKKMSYKKLTDNAGYFSFYNSKDSKNILVLPGGGYENVCFLTEGYPIALRLYEMGYNAFVCNYSIREKAIYPNPLNDIASILKDIKSNYEVNDYAIMGFSAGAHLAGLMALNNIGFRKYNLDNPSFVILAYPVVTMKEYTHLSSRRFLLGENPSEELKNELSIEENIDSSYPKTYLWHCTNDDCVNSINSKMLKDALDKNNVKNKLELFDSTIHGLALGDNSPAEGWLNRALDFWNE